MPDIHPIASFIGGGAAGGLEAIVTYPFEFAKVRLQLQGQHSSSGLNPRNPIQIVRHTCTNEGFLALYRGCSALILGSIAKDSIRFFFFDAIKAQFQDPETRTMTPLHSLLAGMTTGFVSSTFASTPTERIKTAVIDDALGAKRFRSPIHALEVIWKETGLLGLYRGYIGTTLRQSSSTAFRMGTYSVLKDLETLRGIEQSTATNFGNGAIAGLITTVATQPFDVIKTRSQNAKGSSTLEAFRSIIIDDGIQGFWRGTSMRLGRTILSAGILFATYERIINLINPLFCY